MTVHKHKNVSKRERLSLPRHAFKPEEWAHQTVFDDPEDLSKRYLMYVVSRQDIISGLREYKRHFLGWMPGGLWTRANIEHFLELNNHLYPGLAPAEHHVRCVYTILSEVNL